MGKPLITIVDYSCGNIASLRQAFIHQGANVEVASTPEKIRFASILVLPGVGSFPTAMAKIKEMGMYSSIKKHVADGKPLAGICLGMQLLFQTGSEFKETPGLRILDGTVEKLEIQKNGEGKEKLPHIGWRTIDFAKDKSPIFLRNNFFYFNHSYAVRPEKAPSVFATCEYGGNVFCAVVKQKNILGLQFHPEKSGRQGLEIITNIINQNAFSL